MFPSHFPLPYVIHLLVVAALLAFVGYASWVMSQPLGLAMVVFGLNALPSLPLVGGDPSDLPPDTGPDDDAGYHGGGKTGFVP